MIDAGDPDEFIAVLKKLAVEFGLRFLANDRMKHGAKGFSDPGAWIDMKINGLTKLNCFIRVPKKGYIWVHDTQWSDTRQNKRVDRPPVNMGTYTTKGARGTVLDNGKPSEISRQVITEWGSNLVDESYRVALYENELYTPILMNLEFELSNSKLRETIALNAHVATAF